MVISVQDIIFIFNKMFSGQRGIQDFFLERGAPLFYFNSKKPVIDLLFSYGWDARP